MKLFIALSALLVSATLAGAQQGVPRDWVAESPQADFANANGSHPAPDWGY